MFWYWKTTVNNKIQTVFPSFNRALNTRKTVVFVELTSRENCTIMERIPDSLTRQQRETLDFLFRKMSENAWIMPRFQIVATCFPKGEHNIFCSVLSLGINNTPGLHRIDITFWSVHVTYWLIDTIEARKRKEENAEADWLVQYAYDGSISH